MTADKEAVKSGTSTVVVTCSVTELDTAGVTISWYDGGSDPLDSGITREYSARKFQGQCPQVNNFT